MESAKLHCNAAARRFRVYRGLWNAALGSPDPRRLESLEGLTAAAAAALLLLLSSISAGAAGGRVLLPIGGGEEEVARSPAGGRSAALEIVKDEAFRLSGRGKRHGDE